MQSVGASPWPRVTAALRELVGSNGERLASFHTAWVHLSEQAFTSVLLKVPLTTNIS